MSTSLNVSSRYRLSPRDRKQHMKKQRTTKGYCDGDLWDMDTYLLDLLPSMLKELADRCTSYPADLALLGLEEGVPHTDEEMSAAYRTKLHGIADQFTAIRTAMDEAHCCNVKNAKKLKTAANKVFKEFASVFFTLWD